MLDAVRIVGRDVPAGVCRAVAERSGEHLERGAAQGQHALGDRGIESHERVDIGSPQRREPHLVVGVRPRVVMPRRLLGARRTAVRDDDETPTAARLVRLALAARLGAGDRGPEGAAYGHRRIPRDDNDLGRSLAEEGRGDPGAGRPLRMPRFPVARGDHDDPVGRRDHGVDGRERRGPDGRNRVDAAGILGQEQQGARHDGRGDDARTGAHANPRVTRIGRRSPRMTETMSSTSRVSRTSCTR